MKLLPAKPRAAALIPFKKLAPSRVFKLARRSKAAVMTDKKGVPRIFIFDVFALLDVLSKIDLALVDRLTDEEYHNPSVNPAGWLIDEIEAKLPANPRFIASLRRSIAEAEKKGWIPMAEVEKRPASG